MADERKQPTPFEAMHRLLKDDGSLGLFRRVFIEGNDGAIPEFITQARGEFLSADRNHDPLKIQEYVALLESSGKQAQTETAKKLFAREKRRMYLVGAATETGNGKAEVTEAMNITETLLHNENGIEYIPASLGDFKALLEDVLEFVPDTHPATVAINERIAFIDTQLNRLPPEFQKQPLAATTLRTNPLASGKRYGD